MKKTILKDKIVITFEDGDDYDSIKIMETSIDNALSIISSFQSFNQKLFDNAIFSK